VAAPTDHADTRILLVHRPGAPQSELRVGHIGPSRATSAYYALISLNALLGGQFTSRINRRLREEKGVTYGARTSFDFRRVAGSFSCETSVQSNATAIAVGDILAELEDVRRVGAVTIDELERGKASLTRGYVRNFETAGQMVRAAAQLATLSLADDTFDRFVSAVDAVDIDALHRAALEFIRPADVTVVVVGDSDQCRAPLESLGRRVVDATPEF
jgi:predicted Zn-dependent peptidase